MSAWNPDPVLVEKAAKAIAETHRNLIEWDRLMASSKEHYRVLARAALSVACPLVAKGEMRSALFVRREFVDGDGMSRETELGGVEPETVTRLWEHKQSGLLTRHDPQWRNGADQWSEPCEFVPLSALRLVEEELRQALEVAHSRLRDRARLVRRAERAEADLDLLIRRFALVSARSGMRAQALQLAEECITENVANGEGVDSQPAVLDAIFDALKYEIADEPDGARPGAKSPIQSAPVSPVQPSEGKGDDDGR